MVIVKSLAGIVPVTVGTSGSKVSIEGDVTVYVSPYSTMLTYESYAFEPSS